MTNFLGIFRRFLSKNIQNSKKENIRMHADTHRHIKMHAYVQSGWSVDMRRIRLTDGQSKLTRSHFDWSDDWTRRHFYRFVWGRSRWVGLKLWDELRRGFGDDSGEILVCLYVFLVIFGSGRCERFLNNFFFEKFLTEKNRKIREKKSQKLSEKMEFSETKILNLCGNCKYLKCRSPKICFEYKIRKNRKITIFVT